MGSNLTTRLREGNITLGAGRKWEGLARVTLALSLCWHRSEWTPLPALPPGPGSKVLGRKVALSRVSCHDLPVQIDEDPAA